MATATRLAMTALVMCLLHGALQAADRPRHSAPVPPGLEIEILDPGVDPLGNPAVRPAARPDGGTSVEIPPTVLVHRYYYSGTRSFQGPMLPGGPTILVVNHPRSGERLYLDVQMLPGAPRVHYKPDSIEYDFGKDGIKVCFPLLGSPIITYRNCKPAGRTLKAAVAGTGKALYHVVDRTGLPDLTVHAAEATRNAAGATVDCMKTVGNAVVTPISQAVQMLPGVKMLSTTAEQRATQARDSAVQRAQFQSDSADATIPTLR